MNSSKKVDCIYILTSFLNQNSDVAQRPQRDLAAHTLAQLISFCNYEKNKEACDTFLTYLLNAKDDKAALSRHTYTHSLMYVLKIN